MAKLVQFEAQRLFPLPLADLVWGFAVMGAVGDQVELLLVAARADSVEALCTAAQAAGWPVRAVHAPAAALLAWARHAERAAPDAAGRTLWVHVAPRSATFLFVDGERVHARSVILGGSADTGRGAKPTERSPDLSENLERGRNTEPAPLANQEAIATRLAHEITRTILHHGSRFQSSPPTRVRLTGDKAARGELAPRLTAKLGLPVESVDVLAELELASAASAFARGSDGELALVAGLALRGRKASSWRIDLRPPRLREQERAKRRALGWVCAAVVSASALVGPLWALSTYEQELRAQIARTEAAIAPLRAREAENRRLLAELAATQQRVAAWQSIAERRARWLAWMADLDGRLALADDAWLDRLAVVPGEKGAPVRVTLAGRLVQRAGASAGEVSPMADRVAALLSSFAASPFVSAVEEPRFDLSQPGVMHFECVLVFAGTSPRER
jgi:type IV pilus assembly protein PilM